MKTWIPTIINSVLVAASIYSPNAYSCKCLDVSYEELVDNAKYVFVALMTSAQFVPEGENGKERHVLVSFEALDILKGDPEELDQLVGGLGGGQCGFPVLVGRSLLIQTDETGRLSICNGTRVAYVGFEPWDQYLDGVRNYLEYGSPIEPMEWDTYGPASHTNAEYR